jgi:hypothetical protein
MDAHALSRQNPSFDLHLISTIQMYNIFHVDELVRQMLAIGLHKITLNILQTPTYFDFRHLPEDLKEIARERITTLLPNLPEEPLRLQLRQLLLHLDLPGDAEEFRRFLRISSWIDGQKKQNLESVEPLFKNFVFDEGRSSQKNKEKA